jgi:hypothetical protein
MSTKEKALACLEALPDDAEAWPLLWEEAQRLQAIAEAEADIRAGKTHLPSAVKQHFAAQWKKVP